MMLAAADRGINSGMSAYMLSSTWWLYWGDFRFPLLSNTPRFLESGIAIAKSARSAGVAGGWMVKFGRYGSARSMMSSSCHSFCASCWRALAIAGSQLDGLVLSPKVSPVCMMSVLLEITLCMATRLGLYFTRGKAHCTSSSPVWRLLVG